MYTKLIFNVSMFQCYFCKSLILMGNHSCSTVVLKHKFLVLCRSAVFHSFPWLPALLIREHRAPVPSLVQLQSPVPIQIRTQQIWSNRVCPRELESSRRHPPNCTKPHWNGVGVKNATKCPSASILNISCLDII